MITTRLLFLCLSFTYRLHISYNVRNESSVLPSIKEHRSPTAKSPLDYSAIHPLLPLLLYDNLTEISP
jgi:hypothetical protein